ncbi:exonuclease domain-containing protein [Tistrella bauzanensis]|uniref:exonuclease domain-containing protein n=1 Tax=Tistrella TaxID=171436 RepID=UPI0031F66CBB
MDIRRPVRDDGRLALTLGAAAILAGLALLVVAALLADAAPALLMGGTALAVGGLSLAAAVVRRRRVGDARLRGDLAQALRAVDDNTLPLPDFAGDDDPGHDARLLGLARALAERARAASGRGDHRLAALVAALPVPVLGLSPTGLVTLANPMALDLLGADAVAAGTSVYAALARESLDPLLAAAVSRTVASGPVHHVDGRMIGLRAASVGGGWVLVAEPDRMRSAVVATVPAAPMPMALALHDLPPDLPPAADATPLDQLPGLSLDLETTGLNVAADRMLSLGAVRLVGGRLFVAAALDMLVDPGVAIPASATRIHGIDAAMIAGAPPPAVALERLRHLAAGTVLIGHNIGFDLAILKAEAERLGGAARPWPDGDHAALDTLALYARLEPDQAMLDLEHIAERLGIAVSGRHTALGDALLAGRVFAALVPRLAERGVITLGDARDFAAGAVAVITAQRRAGW